MAEHEFKVQVIETAAQWASGVHSRLEFKGDTLSLFLVPAFDSFLIKGLPDGAGDIVVDECGQTYWTRKEEVPGCPSKVVWHLMRHNPLTDEIERVLTFSDGDQIDPRELWLTPNYLWIFHHPDVSPATGHIWALSRDTFQIVEEFVIEQVIDADFQPDGKFFFALIKQQDGHTQICRSSSQRDEAATLCGTLTKTKNPTAIAVGPAGTAYILDSGDGQLVRFDPVTQTETVLGASARPVLQDFQPSAMQVDPRGVIFLAGKRQGKPQVQTFDPNGSSLGALELPAGVEAISGVGFDGGSGVYLATNLGLIKFTLTRNPIGQAGIFYSGALDNGERESLWHRIALVGNLPAKSSIEVRYHASDNESLKTSFERATSSDLSVEEKVNRIENLFGTLWSKPETFTPVESPNANSAAAAPDLILNPNQGRYLWFKLQLTTFDAKSRPTIKSARIYYPRLSYLRYLPPVYRDEPTSAAFLERFLSIFETGFESLDQEIDKLFRYFDPTLGPKEFLPWLASWINLSLDDDVPEARVRRLIQRAPFIFSRKGTPRAIVEFLEIYTGKSVSLTEFMSDLNPFVVGQTNRALGSGLVLLGSGLPGMRVGDTTVLGHAALRDRVADADEPFRPLVRRFLLRVSLDRDEFQRRKPTLERIVREQAPAHTSFTIRTAEDQNAIGTAVLGSNLELRAPESYRVGVTQLGSGAAIAKSPALTVGGGAWVGSAERLSMVD